jgi:predicted GIY-YIG superfamily endonuclease
MLELADDAPHGHVSGQEHGVEGPRDQKRWDIIDLAGRWNKRRNLEVLILEPPSSPSRIFFDRSSMKRRYLKMLQGIAGGGPREWSVYVLRCGDGSLYTGIAKDVEARLAAHRAGRGAAYTRTHAPVEILYRESRMTRGEALSREASIKRLSRAQKERLIDARARQGRTMAWDQSEESARAGTRRERQA